MIEAALYALLMASPGVTALVGMRIKPQGAPEVQGSAYPHLTYRVVSNVDISRTNLGRGNVWRARMQIDAWAKTLAEASALADEVLAVCDPCRAPDQPRVDLWVMPGCTVSSGAMAQRVPYDDPAIAVQSNPVSRAQRVQTDFHFVYSHSHT